MMDMHIHNKFQNQKINKMNNRSLKYANADQQKIRMQTKITSLTLIKLKILKCLMLIFQKRENLGILNRIIRIDQYLKIKKILIFLIQTSQIFSLKKEQKNNMRKISINKNIIKTMQIDLLQKNFVNSNKSHIQ